MSVQGGMGPIETFVRAAIMVIGFVVIAGLWWQIGGIQDMPIWLRGGGVIVFLIMGLVGLERLDVI